MAEPPAKRFRYETYTQKLGHISVDVGRRKGLDWEKDPEELPLLAEMARLELQDLTTGYQDLARALHPLTRTLPLILLNLEPITEHFSAFFSKLKNGETHEHSGLGSALLLVQALYATVLSAGVPHFATTTKDLVRVGALRALEPKLVEATYSTLSRSLSSVAPSLTRAENTAHLRAAWAAVRPYLGPANKGYVRKALAEAWAALLRKARNEALNHLTRVLLEEPTPGIEAVWANAMKGTKTHLHSPSITIYTILLDDLATNTTEEQIATMRHVTIALVHHCSSSETAPLIQAVVSRLDLVDHNAATSSKAKSTANFTTSTAFLDVLATFLFTRKGKRFPSAELKPTMLKLQSLVAHIKDVAADSEGLADEARAERNRWRKALVACIVGTLNSGKLAQWLNPGVGLIDALWQALPTAELSAFVNMCVAFKWAGIEQFLLAHIARTALSGLEKDPLSTLVLLNNIAGAGFLAGGLSNVQGGKWRQALVKALAKTLASLGEFDTQERRILGQVLELIPYLAGESKHFSEHLVSILAGFLENPESAAKNWQEGGAWNDTHVIGRLLSSMFQLALRGPAAVQEQFKAYIIDNDILNVLVRHWHWSREVLVQVADFAEHWPEAPKQDGIHVLLPNLMSADSALRLSSLRILAVASEDPAIWNQCKAIEQAEISLKNTRDRTTQIARLSRQLAALSDSDKAAAPTKWAINYLIVQLKVNFRPVWAETVTALTSLVGSHAESIWTTVWGELQKTIVAGEAVMPDLEVLYPDWTRQKAIQEEVEDDSEESAEFRCHGLLRARNNVLRAWQETNDTANLDVVEVTYQISKDRLDVLNYEAQLLAVLIANPGLAEKHTRVVVPVVLAVTGASEDEVTVASGHLSTRKRQERTINFLELCAKFVNPKAAYRSIELHTLYLTLLSKGESKVQSVALKCLMTYKSPNLVPYRERMFNLLEDAKFRDELVHLDLSVDSEVIEPSHRPEFIDAAIRLLYGIMMSRKARSSTAQGQGARKQAVLTALSGCSSDELKTLVDLMLEPFGQVEEISPMALETTTLIAPGRQQLGYLTFLYDVLRYLAPQTAPHWPRLISTTIVLVRQAQAGIDAEKVGEAEEEVDEDEEEVEAEDKGAVPLRTVRSTGLKRLVQFLRSTVLDFDFSPYLPVLFSAVISPRLALLEVENTQAPSGTLDLIAALASSPETAKSLVQYDDRTLPKTFACMTAVKVKPAVVGRVFDVIDSLLIDDEPEIITDVLMPHIRPLLDNIIGLVETLRSSANEDIMRRLLAILTRLSSIVSDGKQAQQLAALLAPMLRQPGRQVPEKAKVNILLTLQKLYAISPDFADPSSAFFHQSYNMISNLFQTLHFPASRRALVSAFNTFGEADASLARSVALVADLNAYRAKRMDEPDFDKRLEAFAQLNDAPTSELPQNAREWLPILRSSLSFIQDPEELSIRTNASGVLQRFAKIIGEASEGPLVDQLKTVVLPSLRRILLSKVELVRNEALLVFAAAVRECPGVPALAEMRPLLGDDDETNIFVNLGHIQVHRRARAIRRLRDIVSEGGIREASISSIFLVVLEHILTGSTDVTDHHLVNEAITAVGGLAGQLRWSRYNALINRFLKLGTPQTNQQKFYIRAVTACLDNFHFDLKGGAKVGETEKEEEDTAVEAIEVETEVDANGQAGEAELSEEAQAQATEKITNVVLTRLLPNLSKFVAQKGETEDTVRIPVALGIVKLAAALPDETSSNEILRTVTTVAQILRSKDQDTRDIARDTVGKIAVFLGPTWLVRVIKELRTALQRGPQKHTLAITVHSILVHATTEAGDRFANLDEAVSDAVEVAAEVIWGESGKDVATEGFKTKMREVRGALSRGNDTFQLVSRLVSPSKIAAVLAPVREIMHVSQAVKTMAQVDEVLRRIALGLNSNTFVGPQDILSLCYSLINGNSAYLRPKRKAPKSAVNDRFTVQMKRDMKEDEDVYPQNAHKFVTFGLDLFVTAFRRGKFDFDDINILSRLGPLVNAIGNTLYSPEAGILTLGLKATAAVAKCPVPQVDEALPAFVNNIFKIIKNAGGTAESEVAQTALKTLAVLIRDCKATSISDAQLRYLIEVASPDLEDHERQSCLFTVLRAVVARRFVVPEIYDLMERVSSIMVTSQSTHVQEMCRGVLMQFLLDYPQGKGRLKQQMTFLARNLDYVFESGRISVMEVLSAIFTKFSPELIEAYADMFFVALVGVLANDDAEKCRNMAGALLQQLYRALHEDKQAHMLGVLQGWIAVKEEQPALAASSLAVYGLLCEAEDSEGELTRGLPALITPVLEDGAANLARAEASDIELELDHAVPHQALALVAKALKARPASAREMPWDAITAHLLFPHEWVRFGSARALAVLLAADADALDADAALDVARKSCILLGGSKSETGADVVVDAKLADQLVKLLWNISKHWAKTDKANKGEANGADAEMDEDEDDEGEGEEGPSDGERPLHWLMSRMSFLARRLIIHRPATNSALPGQPLPWVGPVQCILRFFAGTLDALNRAQARQFLPHVLGPVYRITDEGGDLVGLVGPEGPGGNGVAELRTLATEVRDFVSAKVGTTAFSKAWEAIRRRTTAKRGERREKRQRMAVADPRAWAARQEKRGVNKKASKKRRADAFMDVKRARRRQD
ncbi:hypothetical protein CC85DRAFT_329402 [Cutaneotrichosporon oleaginosum]|uniref:Uncharacterized protein n=1 Tax=Cutaneotrichosporon oleaginosum TaxID=879819 RepID=A0A0J0XJ02_9TREE|nr:uncharacterized protein CC85DRAFT_329402 [Cutaneotrichosporon oleaginosum]KLT41051.1 hypothetical protein CC85DRAFT_329402 [Cutaneotrichosporon oleaginosum]TXT12143.1 hypothetical protein COLE_02553 [Cutaneotrichosporon oleaginosum]